MTQDVVLIAAARGLPVLHCLREVMQDAWIDPPLMFTPAFPLSTPGPHTHYKQMNFKPCTNCLLFHYIFYEPLRALIVLYQITANSHAVLNHWRPCSCCCHSMCLEQSSSRSVPIPDIFYFQNTPESHLFNISFLSVWLYHWNNLPVDLCLSRTFSTFKTHLNHICSTYHSLQFGCYYWLFFIRRSWSRLCSICLSKFVIITLH